MYPSRHPGAPLRTCFRRALLYVTISVIYAAPHTLGRTVGNRAITAAPPAEYVGSEACARCHRAIYNSYMRGGMGRSMSLVTPALLKALHLPAGFYDARQKRHYQVYSRNGELFQSEYEAQEQGGEVFRTTQRVQWIVGSGENIFGAITQREGYLFEAPLAFYTKPMSWGLAPGYEFADYGFSRPILAGCIVCHSGRAQPVPSTNGEYRSTPFSELAIGCEKCHGPGAAHIGTMSNGAGLKTGQNAIVNPARLSPALANDICMQCHEIGDERILKPGKSYQDVRPGAPLDDVVSILMVPPSRESPSQKDHLQQYYSMTLSKCYRATEGRLACITCHDPHVEPSALQAPAAFNPKCLRCHDEQSCSLPIEVRRRDGRPPDNCIGCHMRKRAVGFILHTSLTNHRITRRPDESFPEVAFRQTTAGLPGLIQLNPAPGRKMAPPPPLTLLQAYGELAADKPQYVASYIDVLNRLSKTQADNALVNSALGGRDLQEGRWQQAVAHLRRALQIDPGQAAVHGLLAEALLKLGRSDEALTEQQKAVALDPFNPILQKSLVLLFIQRREYGNAQASIEQYLATFPQDSFMRHMLTLAQGGKDAK